MIFFIFVKLGNKLGANLLNIFVSFIKAGHTATHLAAKNGHLSVLEVLKGKVSFRATSKKVLGIPQNQRRSFHSYN